MTSCTRREFAGLLGGAVFRGAAVPRPNIILFECDSMDGRVMGSMGHPAAVTPNLDRLAAAGTLLRNTYCNSPQCVPSRSSMWSGLQTHHCEGWSNSKGLERSAPTFQNYLEAGGYTAAIFGKTDYLSGGHGLSGSISAWTRAANIMLPEKQRPGAVIRPGGNQERQHQRDWAMVDETIAWLRQNAKRSPFFLHCGPSIPHPPFVTSRRWFDAIDPARVTIPPYETKLHPAMEYMSVRKNTFGAFSHQEIADIRRTYFAMIAELDAMVGRVVRAVDELGLRDSTYFIFTSDHGEMNMEHRQFLKNALYEGSARVPLIVTGPGVKKGAAVNDLVSLIDIYPTLMDMAGLGHPAGLEGTSLMPLLTGRASRRPDWVLSQYHSNMGNTGSFMLRRGSFKYIAYAGFEPQLFDLQADPEEMRNLAKTRPEVARDMENRLRGVIDYPAVDAKVKAFDKEQFRRWRATLTGEKYHQSMAQVYLGWKPHEHEPLIAKWLETS